MTLKLTPAERGKIKSIRSVLEKVDYGSFSADAISSLLKIIERLTAERQERCPRCDSSEPKLHPAMQLEGEVQPCPHEWHAPGPL